MAAEELDAMMLRLDKVKISVDNEGGIVIEGKTAENADRDAVGKAIINGYITDQLQDNAIAGTRDEFKLAADHLLMYYDEQMEDADKNDRKLVTTFENSIVESHVSSPEMEKKLKDSVTEDVNEMVQDAGIELVNPLEVEVDKNGKIRVTNLEQQGLQTKLINDVMNQINAELQIAGHGGKNSQNSIMTVVDRIKENVNKLKVYQKGGAGQIMVNAKNIEIESDA